MTHARSRSRLRAGLARIAARRRTGDRRLAVVARAVDRRRPGRLGERDGRHAGRGDRPIVGDSRDVYWRATKATVWAAFRGLVIGGPLAFIAALVAAAVPTLRRSITRLAAIANAAPWVAVAPCLIVMLGRDRGPVAVAAIAVFFFVFVLDLGRARLPHRARPTTCSRRSAPAAARRVRSVQLPAMLAVAARRAQARGTGVAGGRRSSASGTAPTVGSACC